MAVGHLEAIPHLKKKRLSHFNCKGQKLGTNSAHNRYRMLHPEAALLVANGFCTVRLAQGSQLTAPGCSQDSFAAALPDFPHPSTKGETHAIICAALPKQLILPTAHELAPGETGEAHSAEAAGGQGKMCQAAKHRLRAL